MKNCVNDMVVLLKLRDEVMGKPAEYERYTLNDVVVRETFSFDSDSADSSSAVVYFLKNVSVCRNQLGATADLPILSGEDMIILHAGTACETTLRIAQAVYYIGKTIAHTRITLK